MITILTVLPEKSLTPRKKYDALKSYRTRMNENLYEAYEED